MLPYRHNEGDDYSTRTYTGESGEGISVILQHGRRFPPPSPPSPPFAKHRIFGLVGFRGAGKDTAAAGLIAQKGHFKRFTFAEAIKKACAIVFCWDEKDLEGDTPASREWREKVDPFWSKKLNDPEFTPRKALQKFGTEAMRDVFSPDIWVTVLENKATPHLESHDDNSVVIPDTRFPNEIAKIRELGGSVYRIKKGEDPVWFQELMAGKDPKDIEGLPHISEWAFYQCELDGVIENDGTIEDLGNVITGVYETLKRLEAEKREVEEHNAKKAKI